MRTLLMTTAVALLIGGAAHAADETTGTTGMPGDQAGLSQTFSGWDTNKDTYLTREEYEAGVQAHPTPDDFPGWDALDAAYADPQGRLLLEDSEKWYPASAITRGTSDDLGGGGDDNGGMGGAGTNGAGAGDNGAGDGADGGDAGDGGTGDGADGGDAGDGGADNGGAGGGGDAGGGDGV